MAEFNLGCLDEHGNIVDTIVVSDPNDDSLLSLLKELHGWHDFISEEVANEPLEIGAKVVDGDIWYPSVTFMDTTFWSTYYHGGMEDYASRLEFPHFVSPLVELMTTKLIEDIPTNSVVYDFGAGVGIIGITLGNKGYQVTCVDDWDERIQDIQNQAKFNPPVSTLLYDLTQPLPEEYWGTADAVIAHPPLGPGSTGYWKYDPEVPYLYHSMIGGENGTELQVAFAENAHKALKPGGKLYMSKYDDDNELRTGATINELLEETGLWGSIENHQGDNPGERGLDFIVATKQG